MACELYITEPNGIRLTVAAAISGGDFQAVYCCKDCKKACEDNDRQ